MRVVYDDIANPGTGRYCPGRGGGCDGGFIVGALVSVTNHRLFWQRACWQRSSSNDIAPLVTTRGYCCCFKRFPLLSLCQRDSGWKIRNLDRSTNTDSKRWKHRKKRCTEFSNRVAFLSFLTYSMRRLWLQVRFAARTRRKVDLPAKEREKKL